MQQEYRQMLERQEVYGLQRSEIGQIASKIGQLYYHLYIRSGDLRFLKEAFIFYSAISQRGYFEPTHPDGQSTRILFKRLRYFARYIVVTLLSDQLGLATQLAQKLAEFAEDYARVARKEGIPVSDEWEVLVSELYRFIGAESLLRIQNTPAEWVISHRLATRALATAELHKPHIEQAILVSNFSHQIKFSELTLDVYRICHLLEASVASIAASDADASETTRVMLGASDKVLPSKHILYRPTAARVLSFMSQSHHSLSRNHGILFVYFSADGVHHSTEPASSPSAQTTPPSSPRDPPIGRASCR